MDLRLAARHPALDVAPVAALLHGAAVVGAALALALGQRPRARPAALGEHVQRRVAVEVEALAVGDHRVERAAADPPDLATGVDAERDRRALAEVRVEHQVADDDRAAGDPAAGVVRPAHVSGPRVEGVQLAVVGAGEHRAALGVGHRRRRVDVAAGLVPPRKPAVLGAERVDEAVGVAEVHPAVGDRRGRIERAGLQAERAAAGPGAPDAVAVGAADRRDLAGVVAEDEHAVVERQRGLHRAAAAVGPADRAVAGAQRVDRPVLAAEVEAAAVEQRRGLRPARQLARPLRAAVVGVGGHDAPGAGALVALE